MKYSALVPMKALALAKSRLAPYLLRERRETLVLGMLHHVVHTLCTSKMFEQVYVVSTDTSVLELARSWGAEPLLETQQGHNPALQEAARTILERIVRRHSAFAAQATFCTSGKDGESASNLPPEEGLLTISADLPLLTLEDIRTLIQQAEQYQVVLASSGDSTGTNALLACPPLALPYLFGPNSLPAYISAARQQHISYTVYHSPNLAFDIDTIEDLRKLERYYA